MSSFRTLLRRGLGLSVTLVAIGALLVFSGVALADQSEDLHCPAGWDVKDDSGMDDNEYVPEAGLLICVKAGSPNANEEGLGNTGLIYTDGETTLQEYLYEAGIVDGSGEVGRDVSYWVTYPELSAEIHVWKDAPDDPDEVFDFGGGALLKDGEHETANIGTEYLVDGSEDVTIAEQLTAEQEAAGWMLDEVVCDTDAVEPTEGGVVVTVEAGDEFTCTFTNVLAAEEATPTPTPTPTASPTPTPAETGGVLPGNPTPTPAGGISPDTALPMVGSSLVGIGLALLMAGSLLTLLVARVRRAR
jgi:hypothetical protein